MTMSISDYPTKENSHDMKDIQGGEKKVMKKILSVALSTAMAFSMFASVAFGAESTTLTPQQKFDALKTKNIVTGLPDGLSHLEKTLTRAELAKMITNAMGLKQVTGVYTYKDKNYGAKHWAAPFIEAVTAAKIMEGTTVNGKQFFNPAANVTAQELAVVLTRALNLEVPTTGVDNNASKWAQGQVQAVINAKLFDAGSVTNWAANATRSQAVVAAYAVDQIKSIPTVASYKVIDATHVEFTLSTGEVVKAELKEALLPNVEKVVEFQNKDGKTISTKVTWVVTAATKVEKATATNLKQVVVTFDGEVDQETAENVNNYNVGRTIDSAVLAADKKSVLLTLAGEDFTAGNKLDNQKETKLTVDGVKDSLKTKTFKQELKFTPLDVTTPAIKEVKGLGTKAFKVVFSEPVDRATAVSTVNYKVDGKAIAGTVEYAFPDTVIVSTALTTGNHKLTVSNVRDFSDLKVLPVDNDFTVAEDSAAPSVVSSKATDLTKVEITFDEPLKSVGAVYNGISSKAGTVTRSGDKITVVFDKATNKQLSVGENTIVVENATDYSGNSATREVKVTPVLDSERPTVVSVDSGVVTGNTQLKVKYSEAVSNGDTKANYTLRDKDGKVVVGKGTDANGHPIQTISLDTAKKVATINLLGTLAAGKYTLDIAGVQDSAYVPNTILPYSAALTISDVAAPELKKVWVEKGTAYNGKEDVYIFATYTKDVAIEGNGDATAKAKYNVSLDSGATYRALPTDAYVDVVSPDTVRITIPQATAGTYTDTLYLRASLISDADGHFGYESNGYVGSLQATANLSNVIGVVTSDVKATSKNQVSVKFSGKLTSINPADFVINKAGTAYPVKSLVDYTYSSGNTIATFSVDDNILTPNPNVTGITFGLKSGATITTQDAFGTKVSFANTTLQDAIAPASEDNASKQQITIDATDVATNKYVAHVQFNEPITAIDGTDLVSVAVQGTVAKNVTSVNVTTVANELLVTFVTDKPLVSTDAVTVTLGSGNATAKVVKDAAGNAAESFSRSELYGASVYNAPAAAALTVTPTAATTAGTKVTVGAPAGAGNTLKAVVTATAPTAPKVGDAAPAGGVVITGTSVDNVAATVGQFISVYECDQYGRVIGFAVTPALTATEIK